MKKIFMGLVIACVLCLSIIAQVFKKDNKNSNKDSVAKFEVKQDLLCEKFSKNDLMKDIEQNKFVDSLKKRQEEERPRLKVTDDFAYGVERVHNNVDIKFNNGLKANSSPFERTLSTLSR